MLMIVTLHLSRNGYFNGDVQIYDVYAYVNANVISNLYSSFYYHATNQSHHQTQQIIVTTAKISASLNHQHSYTAIATIQQVYHLNLLTVTVQTSAEIPHYSEDMTQIWVYKHYTTAEYLERGFQQSMCLSRRKLETELIQVITAGYLEISGSVYGPNRCEWLQRQLGGIIVQARYVCLIPEMLMMEWIIILVVVVVIVMVQFNLNCCCCCC
ncbi:MAG: hypothetical protein EZS28_050040 [Streblomastix strix]|uniref:Uncharacterized protein n=1 Tax=Streblomastix strix TaxID=222440 RepID=A0A5J4T997_9EUKA|nr:MAG: hypothetical protein EZS28_050040 [Streblomastix strix]